MSEQDPTIHGPSPAEVAPQLPETTQLRVGNVALGNDRLIDPEITLATVNAMLIEPDEQGRILPDMSVETQERDVSLMQIRTDKYTDSDGEPAGRSEIVELPTEHEEYFQHVEAYQQGKGFGPAIYLRAIKSALEAGDDFRTDHTTQSAEAVKMWERLANQGIAIAVEPFVPVEGNPGKYKGYYVVNGNGQPKTPMERPEEKLVIDLAA